MEVLSLVHLGSVASFECGIQLSGGKSRVSTINTGSFAFMSFPTFFSVCIRPPLAVSLMSHSRTDSCFDPTNEKEPIGNAITAITIGSTYDGLRVGVDQRRPDAQRHIDKNFRPSE